MVLPIFPDATIEFQEVVLVIALASILYGSVMAFTQTNARLVAGYSSVAQLGFITLGIFALRPDGADGAVLQMVNHGLVIAPADADLRRCWSSAPAATTSRGWAGSRMRAPVMAALFLIVTMALLAMPGSANFIGEFFILNGVFQEKIVVRPDRASPDRDGRLLRAAPLPARDAQPQAGRRGVEGDRLARGIVVGALVACIVALALYPQLILKRTGIGDAAVSATPEVDELESPRGSNAPAEQLSGADAKPSGGRLEAPVETMNFNAPDIDYAGHLADHRADRRHLRRADGRAICRRAALSCRRPDAWRSWQRPPGLAIWQWGEQTDLVAGALRLDDLALAATLIAILAAAVASSSRSASRRRGRAGHGAFYALLLGSVLGMAILAQAQNLVTFFVGLELLSIPLYVMCGSAIRKEPSLESGLKYLIIGSLGSATLLYGFACSTAPGLDRLQRDRRRARPAARPTTRWS